MRLFVRKLTSRHRRKVGLPDERSSLPRTQSLQAQPRLGLRRHTPRRIDTCPPRCVSLDRAKSCEMGEKGPKIFACGASRPQKFSPAAQISPPKTPFTEQLDAADLGPRRPPYHKHHSLDE